MKVVVQDTWCEDDDYELHEYLKSRNIDYQILSSEQIQQSIDPTTLDILFANTTVIQNILGNRYYAPETYPSHFRIFYHRKIHKSTIRNLIESPFESVFIKPSGNTKSFTGQVITDPKDLDNFDLDEEIYVAERVNFVNEFRLFIGNSKLLYIRESSDYILDHDIICREIPPKDFIEEVLNTNKNSWCVIDIGLIHPNTWAVVEVNPPFALSSYGLPIEDYVNYCHYAWIKILLNKA